MEIKSLNFIPADSKAVSYMGRIDFENPKAPKIYFAGSCITLRFKGSCLHAAIRNYKFYNAQELGIIVDGVQTKVTYEHSEDEILLTLCENLENKEHEAVLYKRQDASHWFEFTGFYTDGEALPAKPLPKRRMECYGDSVSAGQVCEAMDYVASCDPEGHEGTYDNSWYSYSMITARNLGASLHNIAQGGISIFDGTGYYHAPDYIGMETAYNKLCYFPEGGYSDWDFSKYIPQVVIMAVGQNDPHFEGHPDNDIEEPSFRERWLSKYTEILSDIHSRYNNPTIILITTVLMHSPAWDEAIEEAKDMLKAKGIGKVHHFMFKRNGAATPGHPRISEQYEMAEELTAFISSLGDDIWE